MLIRNMAMSILGCTGRTVAIQTKAVLVCLDSAPVWPHLEQCVSVWGSPFWRNVEELSCGQRNSSAIGLGVVCGEAERPGLL